MATLQQVIQLVFEGVDNASAVTKDLGQSFNELSASIGDIAEPFAELAEAIELTAVAIGGIAGVIGTVAVKAAVEFSSALNDLDRFLQEGEGAARDYRATFQDLAVEYGVSANAIIQSTADWSAANFKIKDALDLTTLSLKFATAGQLEAAQATELLKQLMSGLNLEQEESVGTLQKWGDIINFIADASKSDFQELAIAVAGLAPSFNTSGASAEQFASIINSSVELFQSGSKAADGLRTIIGQLTTPTKDAAAALADFGVTVNDAGVIQGTFFDVLSKIAAKWPSLTAEQQRNAAATIVSAERADQFKNILDTWPRSMGLAEEAITKSSGSIAREVERALATSEVAFARFGQALNNLLVAIGENLEPVTVDVTNALRDLAQAFQKLIDSNALAPLFAVLERQGAELAAVFKAMAGNLSEAFKSVDLGPLAAALEALGDAFGDLFAALFGEIDLTTVEGLASAIQTIVDVGTVFVRTLEGIVTGLEPLAEGLRATVLGFEDLDVVRQLEFGQFLGAMQTISIVGPKVGAALLLISQTALEMQTVINFAFGASIAAVNAFQVAFDGVAYVAIQTARGLAAYVYALAELDAYMNRNSESAEEYRQRADRLRATIDDLGVVAEGIGENFNRNAKELREGWNRAMGEADEKSADLAKGLEKTRTRLQEFGKGGQEAASGVGALGEELRKSLPVAQWDGMISRLDELASSTQKAEKNTIAWGEALGLIPDVELPEGVQKTADVFTEAGKSATGYAQSLEGVSTKYEQIGGGTVKATGAFAAVGDSAQKTAQDVEEATKKSDNFLIKMEEIASNERIKTIEATVQLNVARLETDAERVKATFASIDTTISSTGDLLGNLFGLLADADTYTKLEVQDQIDLENQRRQEALDIQKKLAEAEIARIEAQTRALERGDAIIRIDGTGLAPQLEAFMWEILKAIRVRANAEFADYLLGVT